MPIFPMRGFYRDDGLVKRDPCQTSARGVRANECVHLGEWCESFEPVEHRFLVYFLIRAIDPCHVASNNRQCLRSRTRAVKFTVRSEASVEIFDGDIAPNFVRNHIWKEFFVIAHWT